MIQNKLIIKIGNGNFVLHGFSTEKDLKLCEKSIERLLNVMCEMSFSEIIKTLAPYREKQAKNMDRELNHKGE